MKAELQRLKASSSESKAPPTDTEAASGGTRKLQQELRDVREQFRAAQGQVVEYRASEVELKRQCEALAAELNTESARADEERRFVGVAACSHCSRQQQRSVCAVACVVVLRPPPRTSTLTTRAPRRASVRSALCCCASDDFVCACVCVSVCVSCSVFCASAVSRRAQALEAQLTVHKQRIDHAQKEWGETHTQLEEHRTRLDTLTALQKEAAAACQQQLQASADKVCNGVLWCVLPLLWRCCCFGSPSRGERDGPNCS
jgi:septal ring factor EnvC (AmiA/AmiB activator)